MVDERSQLSIAAEREVYYVSRLGVNIHNVKPAASSIPEWQQPRTYYGHRGVILISRKGRVTREVLGPESRPRDLNSS